MTALERAVMFSITIALVIAGASILGGCAVSGYRVVVDPPPTEVVEVEKSVTVKPSLPGGS